MPISVRTVVSGVDTIQRRMKKLRDKVQTQSLRRGLSAISGATVKAVKAMAPADTTTEGLTVRGLYRKSIGRKVKVTRGKGYALVGARRGFKTQVKVTRRAREGKPAGSPVYQDPAKIGHLIEFGHGGPHPAPAKPHLRPGYDLAKSIATRVMADEARKDLVEAARG